MIKKTVKCGDCNKMLEDDTTQEDPIPCPNCGSIERNVELFSSDEAHAHEKIVLKEKLDGTKKPVRETVSCDELCVTENKWVSKKRIIDRENDRYREKIEDPETGKTYVCDEPLSKYHGHGSAKKLKE